MSESRYHIDDSQDAAGGADVGQLHQRKTPAQRELPGAWPNTTEE